MIKFGMKLGSIACAMLIAGAVYAQQTAAPAVQPTTPPSLSATDAATADAIGTAPAAPAATGPDGQPDRQPTGTWSPQPQSFPGSAAQPSPASDRPVADTANQRGELGVWLVETGGPGVEVRRVTQGSAADQAGLQSGDVILELNGQGASSPHEVARMIRDIPVGDTAMIQFWRNGQVNELQIALQPARQSHEVGFRGDANLTEMNGAAQREGDLEIRTSRLEQQLAMVMEELRQLRQEIAMAHSSGATPGAAGATTSAAGATTADSGSALTQPVEAATPTTGAIQETAPAASPTESSTPVAPATEATETSESNDLFQ